MMRCHCDMGELVSAVLDGEATDLERAAVRRHLRSCGACREFSAFSRAARVRAREDTWAPPAQCGAWARLLICWARGWPRRCVEVEEVERCGTPARH